MKRNLFVLLCFTLFYSVFADGYDDINKSLKLTGANGKLGYVNKKTGKIVVPFRYDYIDSFYTGLALVGIGGRWSDDFGYSGGKWGFVDTNGVEVIPVIYDAIDNPQRFDDGVEKLGVQLGNKFGYVEKNGKFTIVDFDKWIDGKY